MPNVNIDLSYTGIEEKEVLSYEKQVKEIYENLNEKANDENEFVGWLKLPSSYDKKEFARIKKAANCSFFYSIY